MCGIFGILAANAGVSQEILAKAVTNLAHRGPDDTGTTIIDVGSANAQLGLAHTRLSIIDLSPLGHQPMHDASTGNWIVYNGEIYNFRELRSELEVAGHRFQSHSDTEVILAAYRTWGEDSFPRLRGMFAFAIWDALRRRLLLVRDPMGIKPLYYHHDGQLFLFASEVRALLRTGLVPRQVDPKGLLSFLEFGSVYEPWTIAKGISAVLPGQIVSLTEGHLEKREYWNPLPPADYNSGGRIPNNPEQSLPHLLRDAVMSHLVSDVPVGVFLSGGIDSSSLVAIMSQAGVRPTSFSLVFQEEKFNEAEYSRTVARHFMTDHHEIMVSQEDMLSAIPEALRSMDQPTIDGINTWLVSSKARTAGVKVALTGLGADEMFAGYSNFRRVPRMERAAKSLAKLPLHVRRPLAVSIAALSPNSDRKRKLSELANGCDTAVHPYFLARTLFTHSERKELCGTNGEPAEHELQRLLQESVSASSNLDPVNRVSYLESHWYMRNTLLRDSDFMSMAHGLELRVPFLDRALIEACFRISGKEKLSGDSPKNLLLKNLGVELPPEIVHRPKRGFTLPFERWLRGEMRALVEGALQRESFMDSWLNAQAVREVWDRFSAGETSWSRPWSLFVLERWCQQNL